MTQTDSVPQLWRPAVIVLRLVVAWAATLVGLVYPGVRFVVCYAEVGRVHTKAAAVVVAALAFVALVTWRIGCYRPLSGRRRLCELVIGVSWLVVTVAIGRHRLEWRPGIEGVLLLYGIATLWLPWLAWRSAWPVNVRKDLVTLLVLLAGAVPLFALTRSEGMSGNNKLIVVFRPWRLGEPSRSAVVPQPSVPRLEGVKESDWPGFLGHRRNGQVQGVHLADDWAAGPPRRLWRKKCGTGWSSCAIVGNLVFTQEQRGDNECVVCYDLLSGSEAWLHTDAVRSKSTPFGSGPQATPTVAEDGKVYTIGVTGLVNCLDASSGVPYWSARLAGEGNVTCPELGYSASPLVVGERVYFCGNGTEGHQLFAFDRQSGKQLGAAGSGGAGYSSPMLASLGGVTQLLAFTAGGLSAYDATGSQLLWQYEWDEPEEPHSTQPVVCPGPPERILLTSGPEQGAVFIQVDRTEDNGWKVTTKWTSRRLKSRFSHCVVWDDTCLGLDAGILVAIDLETGKRLWKRGRFGHGHLLLIGERILATTAGGDLVLIEPSRVELKEKGRVSRAVDGKCWNAPAFCAPHVVIRTDREIACYELPLDTGDVP